MQLERRRVFRRAAAGGVALGALSMVPLCVLEIAYVLLVHRPVFGSYGEAVRFSLYLVMLLVCGGAVLGAAEGMISLGVSTLTAILAKKRVAEPRWMAWLYSLLSLPFIAVVCAKAFAGRRAQLLPGKDLIALGTGVVALFGTYAGLRLIIGARDRLRIRRWGPRHGVLLAAGMMALGTAIYVADQRVLVRLYTFFHVGLFLMTVACFQLASGAIYMGFRPRSRWMGRLAEPNIALLIFIGAVAGVTWSINRVANWEALRSAYYQHTVAMAKVLGAASRVGLVQGAGDLLRPVRPPDPLPESALRPGPRSPEANLVLVSVDAMRADHMGIYGYTRRTTPSLDRWARDEAVVFERGYCQVPHTSFSVTSLMTGTYVYSASRAGGRGGFRTAAEVLRRYGYKTAGFFPPAVFYIDRDNFTEFEQSKFGFEYVKYEYLSADKRVDQVIRFLKGNAKQRFFVWMHLFEPHEPYVLHQGFDFGPRAEDRYDSEIAFVDAQLGRLLAHLKRYHPNTVVALTADHGEEFGEHGGHYHGNALYEQQVRVPLVISAPGVKARRVDGPAQVIDLPVTMLSLVDVPVPAEMRGTDLGPWLAGEDPKLLPPVFSEMKQQKVVLHGDLKLICDTSRGYCELYDLRRDPAERRNLISKRKREADQLRGYLMQWMASHARHGAAADQRSSVQRLLERGRQKDTGAIDGLLKLMDGEPEVRREAARLLTLMRTPRAKQALIRAAKSADPGLGIQATVGAALLGHRPSVARLPKIIERPDLPPALRRDALLALARAGDRAATVELGRYLSQAKDIYERLEIIEALGDLGDPAAAPALMEQLKTLRTKLEATVALGKVHAAAAVPQLVRSLESDRFVSWRRAAAQALGAIGDRAAVGALQRAVRRDLEADVVSDALQALEPLGGVPVPGLRQLRPGQPTCGKGAKGSCQVGLGLRCEALKSAHYLLLVPPADARGTLSVRCGTTRVGGLELGARRAAAVQVPAAASGLLSVQMPETGRGVVPDYAALRPLAPAGAAATSHHARGDAAAVVAPLGAAH